MIQKLLYYNVLVTAIISCSADVKLSDFFHSVETSILFSRSADHSLRLARRLIFMNISVYMLCPKILFNELGVLVRIVAI